MVPDRVRLIDLGPENIRAVRNALEPLGWRMEEGRLTGGPTASTPEDAIEILVREAPAGRGLPSATRLPTLWLLPHGTAIPHPSGEGPQDFVRLPAHREEIAVRARSLARIAALEMELRRYQRELACQIDRRSGLIGSIAEEISSPLGAILEILETLLAGRSGKIAESPRRMLAEAREAAHRVAEQIEPMIDASRAEAALPVRVRLDRLEPKAFLEGLQEWAVPRLRGRRQELSVHLEPDTPPICGDAERLTEGFRHLIDNAHRFSPHGARIEIGAVRDPDLQGFARITVADDGPGVAAEILSRLLAPQSERAPVEENGTEQGVGLSLVRAIAASLGGDVYVSGRSGGGTRIGMRLPLWDSRMARIAEAQALLASPATVAGSAWLCRATTAEETARIASAPSLMVLSPGEVLAICETPPAGVPRLGRVRDFRNVGSLVRALQPRLQVTVIGASSSEGWSRDG